MTSAPKGGKLSPGGDHGPQLSGSYWSKGVSPHNIWPPVKRLFGYIGKYRWAIFIGVLCTMIGSLLSTIGPQYIKEISDLIYDGIVADSINTDSVLRLSIIAIAIYMVGMAFNTVEHYLIPATSERVANLFRIDLAHKINKLPLNYYDNSSTGDVMSRITNDADTVGHQCGLSFSFLFSALTTLVGCLIMMVWTCPLLAVITVIPPIVGFAITRIVLRRTQNYFRAQSRYLGAINGQVEENYYGHAIVRAYGNKDAARREFSHTNDELYRVAYKSRFITSTIPQTMAFIGNLGYVLVCIIGSMLVLRGEITYGVIIAFILYVRMFSHPLMMLADAFAGMQSLAASTERLFELLDAPEMDDETQKKLDLDEIKGKVEFSDVCFSYIEGTEVIHDFSFTVEPGEKVAIVGPTGAGKTTLVNLLMRFYEVDSGDILIDGVSVKELRRDQVHSLFSMVLQDAWVFEGSIRDNLKFNNPDLTDERMEEACRAVGIHDFISTLPQGYDTVISERSGLSAGQKQQVSIARAMLHSAPMIIFDEATSSVDTRTEKHIQSAVESMTVGKTSFLIAHRLSTIRDCDKIIVMKGGKLVETGTHEALLAKGGYYSELYNSQFENCE